MSDAFIELYITLGMFAIDWLNRMCQKFWPSMYFVLIYVQVY